MDETGAGGNAGYLVWRLSMKWRAAVDRAVAPFGLTHAQYSLLASLYGLTHRGREPSQRELADITGLDAIYVSKLVRNLERAGLAARATHPADARAFALSITPHGTAVVEQAIEVVHALQQRLTAPLGGTGGAETQELVGLVRRLLAEPDPTQQGDPS